MDKEKLSRNFLILLGIILLGIFIYRYFVLLPQVDRYGKYTIGEVTYIKKKSKGRMLEVSFIYIKNKNKFENNSRVRNKKRELLGKKFLVLYLSNKHNDAQILLEHPVPDSIKSAPPNGWKELPEWAKNNEK